MEVPFKFIIGYTIVMLIVYSVSGIVYNVQYEEVNSFETEYEEQTGSVEQTNQSLIEKIWTTGGMLWEGLIKIVKILTFQFPNIDPTVMLILNIPMACLNFAYLVGIYPYIKGFVEVFALILDAVSPFT